MNYGLFGDEVSHFLLCFGYYFPHISLLLCMTCIFFWCLLFVKAKICFTFAPGEMAEWSIAAVLKTVELKGSGGSNPSLSAEQKSKKVKNTVNQTFTVFFLFGRDAKKCTLRCI